MKAPKFSYIRAESVDHALELLDKYGDEGRILAGGQSLMPTLNMRLSQPEILIDINGLDDMKGISLNGDTVCIGALTRHVEVLNSDIVAEHLPLIAEAMPHVAHVAIRNRGTFGGSVAFADPAAELPAVTRTLCARFVLQGRNGQRTVAADDFFQGLFETDLKENELLVGAEIPVIKDGERTAFMELARRHGDYAMVGIAVQGRLEGDSFADMRVGFFGAGDQPILAKSASAALNGQPNNEDTIKKAQESLNADLDPMPDLNGPAEMKMHLARVLTKRALAELAS